MTAEPDELDAQKVHLAGQAVVVFRGSGTLREKPFSLDDWDAVPDQRVVDSENRADW